MKIIILIFILVFSVSCYANQNNNDSQTGKTKESTETSGKRPWWMGDLITVLGIIIGAGIIVFQLNRQHKNTIEVQKENYREQLRLKIYQEFYTCLESANDKTCDASMYAFLIASNFEGYLHQITSSINPPPVKARGNEFSDLHFTANNSIISLIMLIEKHVIVSPELEVFKLAFNSASYNISEAFRPLYSFLLGILPMDAVNASGIPVAMNVISPTPSQMSELDGLIKPYKEAHDELASYLYDLNIELQKIFLSRLFTSKVEIRQPIDPSFKVITTEPTDIEILKQYFKEQSPWGIHMNEVEDDVRKNIKIP